MNQLKGFGVTFRTMFKRVVTEQYPETKKVTEPRFHGRHQLNRHPDGLEKCIGCELCAWACPADAIYVEGADNTEDARYSPGERYAAVYQINYLRCIFCGLCIEACPTRSLTMTNEYDVSQRDLLTYGGAALLVVLALSFAWDFLASRRRDAQDDETDDGFDAMAGGHPVPPMPDQVTPALAGSSRRSEDDA